MSRNNGIPLHMQAHMENLSQNPSINHNHGNNALTGQNESTAEDSSFGNSMSGAQSLGVSSLSSQSEGSLSNRTGSEVSRVIAAYTGTNRITDNDDCHASSQTLIRECVNDEIWRETKFLTDHGVQKMVYAQQLKDINGANNQNDKPTIIDKLLMAIRKSHYDICYKITFWNKYGKIVQHQLNTKKSNVNKDIQNSIKKALLKELEEHTRLETNLNNDSSDEDNKFTLDDKTSEMSDDGLLPENKKGPIHTIMDIAFHQKLQDIYRYSDDVIYAFVTVILVKVVGSTRYRNGSCMMSMNKYVDKSDEAFALVCVENSCEKWISTLNFPTMKQKERPSSRYTENQINNQRKWGSMGIRRFMQIIEAQNRWKMNNRVRYNDILGMILNRERENVRKSGSRKRKRMLNEFLVLQEQHRNSEINVEDELDADEEDRLFSAQYSTNSYDENNGVGQIQQTNASQHSHHLNGNIQIPLNTT